MDYQAAAPKRVGEVPQAIAALEAHVKELSDITREIIQRLSPILGSGYGPDAFGDIPPTRKTHAAPLADQLANMAVQIEVARNNLSACIEALEL